MGARDENELVDWTTLPAFSEEFARAAVERIEARAEMLKDTNLHDRMRRSWAAYYSRDANGGCKDETKINASGSKDEVIDFAPAVYRQKIQSRIAQVVQTPVELEPIAVNTDAESQAQVRLVRGIIDHYRTVKHLDDVRTERFEMGSVIAEAYQHVGWDAEAGEPVKTASGDGTGEENTYPGDFVFELGSPYEVWHDAESPDYRRPRGWVYKAARNRFDLLKRFGSEKGPKGNDIREAIMRAQPYSREMRDWKFYDADKFSKHDDCIAVLFVYCERTVSCPNGRQALVLPQGPYVLLDGPLDSERAPIFPFSPARVMFRHEGHSDHFGGLPIAKALGAEYSMLMSNHAAHGLHRFAIARKSNVSPQQLMLGLGVFEYDAYDAGGRSLPPPTTMAPGKDSPEAFQLIGALNGLQDAVQKDSPVLRGDPDATKGDPGNKTALLYSAAQANAAPDMRALIRTDEEIYTHMIDVLKVKAKLERLIMIAGKNQTYTAMRFKGEDIGRISRVRVKPREQFSVRVQIAEMLKDVQDPVQREYLQSVIATGNLEVATDDSELIRLTIQRENEALRDPSAEMPVVLPGEQHLKHLAEHFAEQVSDLVRHDPAAVKRFGEHISLHIGNLDPTSPIFAGFPMLAVTGQQPLPQPPTVGGPPTPADKGNRPGEGGDKPPAGKSGKPPGAGAEIPKPAKNPVTDQAVAPDTGLQSPAY